jgi:PAS domain S-box-containing protein
MLSQDQKAAFDVLLDAVLASDEEGRVTYLNRAAERLLGWTSDQLIGQPLTVLMPERMHARHKAGFERYITTRQGRIIGQPVRVMARRHDGEEIAVELILSPLRSPEGETIVASLRDVRARIELESKLAEEQSATEEATNRLLKISSLFLREGNLKSVLAEIVQAAIAVSGADFGNVQLLDRESGELKIVAHSGFPDWWLEFWTQVQKGHGACGTALAHKERVIIEDVERSSTFVGTPALDIQLKAGVRAVQSTPIIGRGGETIGMLSTHYRTPTRFSDRVLRLLDLIARQAADILDRADAEEALRTSQERLKFSELRRRLLIEAVRDYAIFMLDTGGNVVSWNSGAERLKQYRAEEIIGRHFSAFYPEEEVRAGKCDRVLQEATNSDRFEDECWRVRKDGSVFWANVVITAIRDDSGKLVGFAEVTRDISARKHMEQLREEWLSLIGHDLRQPLGAAKLMVEAGLDDSNLPNTERQAFLHIRRALVNLSRMLGELLDSSLLESQHLTLERKMIDLSALVERVVAEHRQTIPGFELRVIADGEQLAWADEMRIGQVLSNLLTNAANYGVAGTEIRVVVEARQEWVEVTVTNRGRGIAAEQLPLIFSRFKRIHEAGVRKKAGLGLGLYICKGLVEAHGGRVWAESVVGETTSFHFTIPRMPRDVRQSATR